MKPYMALAFLLVAVATPARAQQADPRWEPWLGCWRMLDDRMRDGNPAGADAVAEAGQRLLGNREDVAVCVAPAAQSQGVTLSTRVSGEPAFEQTIVADAMAHPTSEAGCSGSQRAEWSRDGQRLFAGAELTCANQPPRTISGLSLIAADGAWVDVQALEIGGRASVRVRRYVRRAADRATRAARMPNSGGLTIDAVKEASTKVAPAALEAALIETGARFNLNRTTLVDLDNANVPDTVIDLMVALSYPDKFQVERRAETSAGIVFVALRRRCRIGQLHGLRLPVLLVGPELLRKLRLLLLAVRLRVFRSLRIALLLSRLGHRGWGYRHAIANRHGRRARRQRTGIYADSPPRSGRHRDQWGRRERSPRHRGAAAAR